MKTLLGLLALVVLGGVVAAKTHPVEAKAVTDEVKKHGKRALKEVRKLLNDSSKAVKTSTVNKVV